MGTFTRLLKDTSIYGLSSIVAKMVNFLLMPLYTRELTRAEYGMYSEIFAYIALLQVVLTFGLETGFFRFASRKDRDPELVFSTLLHALALSSMAFWALSYLLSDAIAQLMGYAPIAVVYVGIILASDSYTSILFARFRYERKAMRFAVFRTIKILSEVFFNCMFFFFMPRFFELHPDSCLLQFISAEPSYLYPLAAVTCSSLLAVILFIPQIAKAGFRFSRSYLKEILLFSIPLMIAGLQGVSNDFADRLLFRFFTPEGLSWEEQVGVFNANAKLAVIMLMFVQMFRYAAEPFFFSVSNQSDSKELYAKVMRYFTIFCVAIFLFVALYQNLFQLILGKAFRHGQFIVPIMLLSNILLGINQNLSMWYKLSGKTHIAVFITFAGLLVTLIVNVFFMPFYGYYAAACGHLVSYLAMLWLSWRLSKKYYLIPYQWKHISIYVLVGIALYFVSCLWISWPMPLAIGLSSMLLGIYLVFVVRFEHLNLKLLYAALKSRFLKK